MMICTMAGLDIQIRAHWQGLCRSGLIRMMNIEVPLSSNSLLARKERVLLPRPQLANEAFSFSLDSVGGVINGCIQYQIENGATGLLTLSSLVNTSFSMRPIALSFDAQLFPSLIGINDHPSASPHAALVLIVGLTATGSAFFWHLDTSSKQPTLDASSVKFMDLSSLIKPHGIPTSIGK